MIGSLYWLLKCHQIFDYQLKLCAAYTVTVTGGMRRPFIKQGRGQNTSKQVWQSWVRCLDQGSHLSRGQFLPEPRFKPTTSGYKSNALSIRPRLNFLELSVVNLCFFFSWGEWTDIKWCPLGFLTAFKLRVQSLTFFADNSAVNNVM